MKMLVLTGEKWRSKQREDKRGAQIFSLFLKEADIFPLTQKNGICILSS